MNKNLSYKLIAHRGGKFYGLENTKEAFEAAIHHHYYGIECDIQPTKDQKLVVFHDLDLKRLAHIDQSIIDCDWEYLKTIELSKLEVDNHTYNGKIMLFKDFLSLFKHTSIKAFIEMKESFSIDDVHRMLNVLITSEIDMNQIVIIANKASFSLLIEIRKMNPYFKLQFVARTDYTQYLDDCIKYRIDLDISISVFHDTKEQFISNIDRFHQHGLEVNCWVINDINLLKELEYIGIDYITTDSIKPLY